MDDKKLFIDSIDINNYDTIQLQAEKIKVADLLQAFEELEQPHIYHKLAYRYKLDEIMDDLAVYYEIVADLAYKVAELSKAFDQITLPPYIQARINAIMEEQEQLNPNLSEAQKGEIFDALFADGGEFDGLFVYDENGKNPEINNEWLEQYIEESENKGMPIKIQVEFTEEMLKDIEAIRQQGLSPVEQERQISALFSIGGKYNNALQTAYEEELENYNQF